MNMRWGGVVVRWSLKVLGALGLALSQPPSVQASVAAEQAALDARVDAARRLLQGQATEAPAGDEPSRVAQWMNWPNWGNWGNWPNWGNWRNF